MVVMVMMVMMDIMTIVYNHHNRLELYDMTLWLNYD
jgi:hypothetical protein